MKCSHCGAENEEDAVFCEECGQKITMPTPQNTTSITSYPQSQTGSEPKTVNTDQNIPTPTQAENNTIAVLAMVFAFVFPLAGFILGFYGGKIYKEKKNKDLCTAARAIGMVVAFVLLIIIVTKH